MLGIGHNHRVKGIFRKAVLFKHLLSLFKKRLLFITIGSSFGDIRHQLTIFACLTQLMPHFCGYTYKLIIDNAALLEFFVQEVLFIETYNHRQRQYK